jgi:hypothetical protein
MVLGGMVNLKAQKGILDQKGCLTCTYKKDDNARMS